MAQARVTEKLFEGVTTVQTTAVCPVAGRSGRGVIYVRFNAGVSAGVVALEEASDADDAGTWDLVGSASAPGANETVAIHFEGIYSALRVRVSTGITGGDCDATLVFGD